MFEKGRNDILSIYLQEIAKKPRITTLQEKSLAKIIKRGSVAEKTLLNQKGKISAKKKRALLEVVKKGEEAFVQFAEGNLRLVVYIARKYKHCFPGITLIDLIQAGNFALLRAVKEFDWKKGNKFATYATRCIRQIINRTLAQQGTTIKVPEYMVGLIFKYRKIKKKLLQELGREPSPEEIALAMGLRIQAINNIGKALLKTISLEGTLEGILLDKNSLPIDDKKNNTLIIQAILSKLTKREQIIISMRFGIGEEQEPHTLEKIGETLGLTKERIRQIQVKVLKKLGQNEHIKDLQ